VFGRACFAAAAVAVLLGGGCGGSPTGPSQAGPPRTDGPPSPPPQSGQTVVVAAVGDIGLCGSPAVEQTAALVEAIDGQVLLAGDLAYPQGSMTDFLRCFDPAWGAFRRRWRPSPGNHEYETPGAAAYFEYFGAIAGTAARSYYSFRAGDWLVLMLDSNVPTGLGSSQYEFARSELTATAAPCALAVWHHPLFTSGPNGPNNYLRDLWTLLHQRGLDVIVNGHDHLYERFGKQDVDGRSDVRGIRQFIAGTGGAQLYDFMRVTPNSQVRIKSHGVLRLTLSPTAYEWAFVDVAGSVADSGSDSCH
jgi:calcineurin-like phosphoesterase family protein